MASSIIEGTSLLIAPDKFPNPTIDLPLASPGAAPATVVLAGGCFWCTEAVYSQLDGVLAVTPGYAGGTRETADYETVCTGRTNHIKQLNDAGAFTGPIVTTIEPDAEFFEAEAYHHDYARRNPTQGYIRSVSMPKVRKLEKYFPEKLKKA
jgi:peptide methionine sulfoxide reductase MsrA